MCVVHPILGGLVLSSTGSSELGHAVAPKFGADRSRIIGLVAADFGTDPPLHYRNDVEDHNMPVSYSSIAIGKCFAMSNNDVRQVVGLNRGSVSYVLRGKLAFPSWDPAAWQITSQDAFAKEVIAEVAADWRSTGASKL